MIVSTLEAPAERPARIIGVGNAVVGESYSQDDLLDMMSIEDPRIASVFRNSAIERRHLSLPPETGPGTRPPESQGGLLRKHTTQGIAMGVAAVTDCVKEIGADLSDIGYLVCVTSTGFLTPGFSALLLRALNLSPHCGRLDVVGMGCNAGLNGLIATTAWSRANPGRLAVMACVEVCSAAYVMDGTMRSAVVNSLFGDGAAAAAIVTDPGTAELEAPAGPAVLKFSSMMIPEALDAMRYEWSDEHGKFSFFLDREIPYVIGANCETALERLLEGTGVLRKDVSHWLVHSGGKKVIDSVMINLGLTRHDVRHTRSVLRDYGNLSSGSFLFSYDRLLKERVPEPGEIGVLMTMGPGSTIELALIRW
ncbi:3-oxoacyl-[acyl-carrier-protein] synthase III C-terminal domain-containing protein [Catenulispora yoronensis]|uniref:3-oxoacyl-[acyl-carrier-protein] synthase III C-terminal domain-containing protein n=1 Tax=Catenulispora yoronensis TaxID=450799 RepID=A0ABP5GRI0_9ACTN